MAKRLDADQTAQSDLGLHYMSRPVRIFRVNTLELILLEVTWSRVFGYFRFTLFYQWKEIFNTLKNYFHKVETHLSTGNLCTKNVKHMIVYAGKN